MTAAERPVLSFRVGDMLMAAPAETVSEVLRMPVVTRVPHAPASLYGLANIRGVVAPVVSLGRLLGKVSRGVDGGRILVLDLETPVGLAVDEVTSLSQRSGETRAGELYIDGDASVKVVDLIGLLRAEFAGLARPSADKVQSLAAGAPQGTVADDTVGLVTFELAGQIYGLPLEQVREVLRLPAAIASLPQGAQADLGAVPFRNRVLPLVSLRVLLGLPALLEATARVLIVEIGASAVGLVVDRLDAILRASADTISPVPAVLNRGMGEAKITALCRLDGERGLVSVLAPDRLFSDDDTARILDNGRLDQEEMTQTLQSDRESFVVFQLGEEQYGLPIAAVDEVLKLPERLTRVPKTPEFVEGVMNLRGKVVPVIDQGRRFDAVSSVDRAARRVIVTAVDGMQVGFIVDRVSEILALSPSQLSPAPQLPGQTTAVFHRVARASEDRMILLIDPKSLLDQAEADLLKSMAKAAKASA